MAKKILIAHNLFPLQTGNWYLGWWLDDGRKLPEFHSKVFPEKIQAMDKLIYINEKYK